MPNENSVSQIRATLPLLLSFGFVALFTSTDLINILVLSSYIFPGESFRAFEMGVLISVRLFADAIFALLWGSFADKYSRNKLFILGLSLTGFFIICNAFLPIGGGYIHFRYWLINRILLGMSIGCIGPVTNSLVSDMLEKGQRSTYFGNGTICFSIFQVLGMAISANLFILGYWRYYYFVCGTLFCILGLYVALKLKEPKRGIKENCLKEILLDSNVEYTYKITKETFKSTLLSKTNILILFEGIFTSLFFGILDLTLVPYIQSAPHNISPAVTSYFMFIFTIPATLIGSTLLAKYSDKMAKKRNKNRIYLIIFGLSIGAIFTCIVFLLPIPNFSQEEGNSISYIMEFGIFYIIGFILFCSRISFNLFNVNQTPVIQELNLPEGQGKMKSWNQLLEVSGYALGPILAGILIVYFDNDYSTLSVVILLFSIPGIGMWLASLRTFDKDRKNIEVLLTQRANELTSLKIQKSTAN